jgi:hypothetical protein
LHDAATQFGQGPSDAIDGADDVFHHLIDIIRAAVGEFPFGERPDSFVGIKIRSVGGKMLNEKAGMSSE